MKILAIVFNRLLHLHVRFFYYLYMTKFLYNVNYNQKFSNQIYYCFC